MDQSDEKKLENLLTNTEVLDTLNDGVYIVSPDRRILYWNKAAEDLTGFAVEDVLGKRCQDGILMHVNPKGCELCNQGCPLTEVIATGHRQQIDVIMHHRRGYRLPVQVKGTPIHGTGGRVIACVEVFKLQVHTENLFDRVTQTENESLQDPTTKLPNARFIEKTLKIKLTNANHSGESFGMVQLLINKFDQLKSEHSSQLTEKILQITSQSLIANCRVQDTVGRVSENRLVVFTAMQDMDQLKQFANNLEQVLSRCTCELGDERLNITVNVQSQMIQPGQCLKSLMYQLTSTATLDSQAA
ncbi:MAG: diguanylate cyclase domain-containing protein [Phycisphaeraceae bacterium JB051]